MAVNNSTILAKAWLSGTNDFQQRIPDPTVNGIAATMDALFAPMNQQYYNQFVDILVNRIGMTYVRGQQFDNPLAPFKGAKLNYGSTIQEIVPKWIKAHAYEDDVETLLKTHRPDAVQIFHSQNRRDQYPITVNADELRTAVTDEYGLNNLVARIMDVPRNSDEYDEYRIILNLLAYYEENYGFHKIKVTEPTDETTARALLKQIRAVAGKLRFPSTVYNNVPVPVFAANDELVLMVTPDALASIDVDALAAAFNIDRAEIQMRTVVVDEFPVADAIALLTTRDFFVCNDTLYNTTSFYNPQTLGTTYYLNHWGVYSVTPAVPAVLFTTGDATTVPTITQTVTGLNLTAENDVTSVAPGDTLRLMVDLQGTIIGGLAVRPDAATFELSAEKPAAASVAAVPRALNSRTRVDNYGVLHVQRTGLTKGDIIHIKATAAYTNPSGNTDAYTATLDLTVK